MLKMRAALIAVLSAATLTVAAPVQPQSYEWELVARICGKLEHIDRIPDKRIPGKYSEKHLPVKDAKLLVYEGFSNSPCCKTVPVFAEARSSKSGTFEFKGLPTGNYFLVANVDTKEYRMAIRVQKTNDRQPVCSQTSFIIEESGEFVLRFGVVNR